MVKNPLARQEAGLIPGSGKSLGEGNGNSLQDSCLINPMDRGAWLYSSWGCKQVRHDLVTKEQQPCSVLSFAPGYSGVTVLFVIYRGKNTFSWSSESEFNLGQNISRFASDSVFWRIKYLNYLPLWNCKWHGKMQSLGCSKGENRNKALFALFCFEILVLKLFRTKTKISFQESWPPCWGSVIDFLGLFLGSWGRSEALAPPRSAVILYL